MTSAFQIGLTLVPAVLLIAMAALAWLSAHRVPDGQVEVLVVSGEEERILGPGTHFLSPVGARSYRVDPEAMTYETPTGSLPVPEDLRAEVARIAEDD